MDCKVKQHYQYSDFSLSAINNSRVFIQTSTKLISQHILHTSSLKQYTSIAHFSAYLLSVLSLKQIISLHDMTSTELVISSEIFSHKVLPKQPQFPTYFLKCVKLYFPSIINKELLSQKPC